MNRSVLLRLPLLVACATTLPLAKAESRKRGNVKALLRKWRLRTCIRLCLGIKLARAALTPRYGTWSSSHSSRSVKLHAPVWNEPPGDMNTV
jgi:hypothetical protein